MLNSWPLVALPAWHIVAIPPAPSILKPPGDGIYFFSSRCNSRLEEQRLVRVCDLGDARQCCAVPHKPTSLPLPCYFYYLLGAINNFATFSSAILSAPHLSACPAFAGVPALGTCCLPGWWLYVPGMGTSHTSSHAAGFVHFPSGNLFL